MTTGLRFALLGPIRAWRGAEELALGSPQQRVTLALLLLREGKPVSVEEIIDAVWGDEPPREARGTVRTYVYRLRRLLSPAEDGVITSVGGGYTMSVEGGAVDWARFRTRVAAARQARARNALAAASDLLRSAHDLWQGTALGGLRGDFVEVQRTRLAQARLAALEERLEIDLALGRHVAASAELAEAVAADPMRERLRALLMTALFHSGRQAEALAVYDEGRRLLVDELGIEPGADLRELHGRILRAELTPVATPPATVRPPAQLPADPADFVGRAQELTRIRGALDFADRAPVVAVSGFVGMGKTALAVRAAHSLRARFPDGQLFATLGGSHGSPTAPEKVLTGFLTAFGMDAERLPTGVQDLLALWRTVLAERRVLVVLDDAHDVEQVRHLLPTTPGSAAIVTGWRDLVHLTAAHVVRLGPLTPHDAVELLARLVGHARVHAERATAERLAGLASFHPLTIRTTAARLLGRPHWSVARILDHATAGHADPRLMDLACLPARPRVTAVLDRLHPVVARAFRLGPLVGDRLTAEAVAPLVDLPPHRAGRVLETLVDANLLEAESDGSFRYLGVALLYARRELASSAQDLARRAALRRLDERPFAAL